MTDLSTVEEHWVCVVDSDRECRCASCPFVSARRRTSRGRGDSSRLRARREDESRPNAYSQMATKTIYLQWRLVGRDLRNQLVRPSGSSVSYFIGGVHWLRTKTQECLPTQL
jgi:hypothetical protein